MTQMELPFGDSNGEAPPPRPDFYHCTGCKCDWGRGVSNVVRCRRCGGWLVGRYLACFDASRAGWRTTAEGGIERTPSSSEGS